MRKLILALSVACSYLRQHAGMLTETRLTAVTIPKIDSVVVSCQFATKPQTSFYELRITDRESGCAKTILNNY
jgi:hypothetical protein